MLVMGTPSSGMYSLAERILAVSPDPVVRFRLLRDVLTRPRDSGEVAQAWDHLQSSRWLRALTAAQRVDGSWGRFHTAASDANPAIATTEAGVARALALGVDRTHPMLQAASRYMTELLTGAIPFPDPPEKNDRWPTGWRLFTGATLAQIAPDHPQLDALWKLWATIARRTFVAGAYDPEAESRAHRELTGATMQGSYLVLRGRHQLTLLGARSDDLPRDLEAALVRWVWHAPQGVGYFGEPLAQPPAPAK